MLAILGNALVKPSNEFNAFLKSMDKNYMKHVHAMNDHDQNDMGSVPMIKRANAFHKFVNLLGDASKIPQGK